MNDDSAPEAGSPEYDAMMRARYQGQGKESPLTEDGQPHSSHVEITSATGGTVGIRKGSTLGPGQAKEHHSAAQADPGQIADLERDIARIKVELAEVLRYDPRTGEPIPKLNAEQRRVRKIQLAHLEGVELPATRALVEQAQQWRGENVESPLAKLVRERDERDAKRARALELADEMEAQAEAERIMRGRGLGIR